MSYQEGIEQANSFVERADAFKAICDPKHGWKRKGNKCVREREKLPLGKGLAAAAGLGLLYGASDIVAEKLADKTFGKPE